MLEQKSVGTGDRVPSMVKPANEEPSSIGKAREAFARWQGRTMEQLGFVNNLLIGLATGLLAFQTHLAFDGKLTTMTEKWSIALSTNVLFLSAALGCCVAWNRLKSIRLTAGIARIRHLIAKLEAGKAQVETKCECNKEEAKKVLEDEKEDKRRETERLDKRTWILLTLQSALFALGTVGLLVITPSRFLR